MKSFFGDFLGIQGAPTIAIYILGLRFQVVNVSVKMCGMIDDFLKIKFNFSGIPEERIDFTGFLFLSLPVDSILIETQLCFWS